MQESLTRSKAAAILNGDLEAPLQCIDGEPCEMRKHHDVVQPKQWIINERFGCKYIETSSTQSAAPEGIHQCGMIDKPSTSRINKDGSGPHRCQSVAIDQSRGCGRQWRV